MKFGRELPLSNKIVLIDGHSILNRAFYGLPDLTNSEGLHTNAIYGFLTIMFKILEEEKPEYLTVAFDVHAPTFRHEMYEEYKGTRKGMPDELAVQMPIIKNVLTAMNIKVIEKPGYEADDILGTLAKYSEKKGIDTILLTGDRDSFQLASDHITIRIPRTKAGKTEVEDFDRNKILEKYDKLIVFLLVIMASVLAIGWWFAEEKSAPEYSSKIDKLMFDKNNKLFLIDFNFFGKKSVIRKKIKYSNI